MRVVILSYSVEIHEPEKSQMAVIYNCLNAAGIEAVLMDITQCDNIMKGDCLLNIGHYSFAGTEVLNKAAKYIARCAIALYRIDEYQGHVASQITTAMKGKPQILLVNIEHFLNILKDIRLLKGIVKSFGWVTEERYFNWNRFNYKHLIRHQPKNEGIFYYGAFREDRCLDFYKYFNTKLYPVNISSSTRGMQRFWIDINLKIKSVRFMNSLDESSKYKLALYLEDIFTHTHYNSPANRFYECLGAGIGQIFDAGCKNTFDKAGYDISKYIVNCPEDVARMLSKWEQIRDEQIALWDRDYRKEAEMELIQIIKEYTR